MNSQIKFGVQGFLRVLCVPGELCVNYFKTFHEPIITFLILITIQVNF